MRRKPIFIAIGLMATTLLFASSACQNYVFEAVLPGVVVSVNEEIDIPVLDRFDILFVVDDSGSMAGNQTNLSNNLDVFIRLLEEKNAEREAEGRETLDFQIAVASTSIVEKILDLTPRDDPNYDPLIQRTTYSIGRDNSYCLEGTAYHFNSGTSYPAGKLMAAGNNQAILTTQHFIDNPADALRQFRENLRLGTCGSGQEQGLEAMRLVLQQNPDFYRPQSRLVVVFLSDEEDASDHTGEFIGYVSDENGIIDARMHPTYRPALTPVSFYRQFLQQLARDRGGSVAVAAIVSAVGEPPHDMEVEVSHVPDEYKAWNCVDNDCVSQCTDWCNTVYCPRLCDISRRADETEEQFAARVQTCFDRCHTSCPRDPRGSPCWCGGNTPGARYLELARMFSRDDHIMDSVCRSDFSETLEDLVNMVEVDQCLQLAARPQNDDTSLVLVRIEREGVAPIVCRPPTSHGEEACAEGADWWYDPDGPTLCLCDQSECLLQPGDSYRLSIVEEACTSDRPC